MRHAVDGQMREDWRRTKDKQRRGKEGRQLF